MRDKSAWFIAEDDSNDFTVEKVRLWMGDFSSISNTAKCSARIGLFFSSSHLSIVVPQNQTEEIEDIYSLENKENLMTDGIGKIVPELAREIAFGLFNGTDNVGTVPSSYQVRYAGYKGVLSVWPAPSGSNKKIFFRPSMRKFKSAHENLEILEWSRFLPGFLNRQIILLLSALGVHDKVFIHLQVRGKLA